MFFGYRILQTPGGFGVKLAEPEKAVLDYLYFHPELQTIEDFVALRWNTWKLKEDLNEGVLKDYATLFDSAVVYKRLKIFQKFLTSTQTS